jgi:hemolysin III
MIPFQFREPASSWTHFLWLVLSVPATWLLWQLARGSTLKRVGVLVFGFSLTFCYAGSFLFHSVPKALARPFNTVDHIGIYLLIAGTVTPIALVVLRGWWRIGLLSGIWALALTGIILRLTTPLSITVMTVFYLAMGWVGCSTYYELARHLSHARLRPLWIGGLFYTIGAVFNSLHWPVIVPGTFGSHEVFHVFVMAGSAWHFYFMLSAVLPYQPLPAVMPVQESGLAVGGRGTSEPAAMPG